MCVNRIHCHAAVAGFDSIKNMRIISIRYAGQSALGREQLGMIDYLLIYEENGAVDLCLIIMIGLAQIRIFAGITEFGKERELCI